MLVDITDDRGLAPMIRASLDHLRASRLTTVTSFVGQMYIESLLRVIDHHEQEYVPFHPKWEIENVQG